MRNLYWFYVPRSSSVARVRRLPRSAPNPSPERGASVAKATGGEEERADEWTQIYTTWREARAVNTTKSCGLNWDQNRIFAFGMECGPRRTLY